MPKLKPFEFDGVDMEMVLKVYSPQQLVVVAQILINFPRFRPLVDYLEQYRKDILATSGEPHIRREQKVSSHRKKQAALKRKAPTGPIRQEDIREPGPMQVVVGVCPRCGGPLGGMPVPSCETKETGRVFLKECFSCSYYTELFKKRKQFTEMEGG